MSALNPAPKPQRRRGQVKSSPPEHPGLTQPADISQDGVDNIDVLNVVEPSPVMDNESTTRPRRSLTSLQDTHGSDWLTPSPSEQITATAWATSDSAPPPAQPPLGHEGLTSRARKRLILLIGVYVVVGLLAVNALVSVFNRGPSTDDVAQQISTTIASDSSLAAIIGTGEQFLRAYYNINPSSETSRRAILEGLTGGNGGGWVATNKDATPQTVLFGPTLAYPITPSNTYLNAYTAAYTLWVSTDGGEPTQILVSVPIEVTEQGRGVVVAPPALLPLPAVSSPVIPDIQNDTQLSDAATANLEQFLKAWSQASPNTTGEVSTQLQAFMAPEASINTRSGLGGAVSYVGVSDVRLAPIDESSTTLTGTVLVRWVTPAGVQMQQNYSIDMVNVAGKWLVSRIGAL